MIDEPPRGQAQPTIAARPASGGPLEASPVSARKKRRISLPGLVIGLTMLGSAIFIGYVVLRVEENQIPLVASGFVVLGGSLAATALWCVVGIWRAASRAEGGRAMALAIVGGLAGMGAIGCFTVAALSALVWNA